MRWPQDRHRPTLSLRAGASRAGTRQKSLREAIQGHPGEERERPKGFTEDHWGVQGLEATLLGPKGAVVFLRGRRPPSTRTRQGRPLVETIRTPRHAHARCGTDSGVSRDLPVSASQVRDNWRELQRGHSELAQPLLAASRAVQILSRGQPHACASGSAGSGRALGPWA